MQFAVTAGALDDRRTVTWSATDGLSGDPTILGFADLITEVRTHPEDPPVPVDWTNGDTAIPALIEAAQEAWGQPVTVTVLLDPGETAPPDFRSAVEHSLSIG